MSPKGLISLAIVLFVFCDNSLFAKSHSVHHSRHHPNPFFRHSHYHTQHLHHPRANKRARTDLDHLLEKLNVTEDYHSDRDNNLDSLLAVDTFGENLNESVTTEQWKTSSPTWQTDVFSKPEEANEEDSDNDDADDDEEFDEEETEENKDSTTKVNTQSDSETGYRNPISDLKWKTLANREDLDKYFNKYRAGVPFRQPDSSFEQNEAFKHISRMSRETSCKIPRPKVVKVADHYPSTAKYYSPQCTILHECSQDTGCCPGNQKCVPKTTKQVILYFHTITQVYRLQTKQSSTNVEKLKFYNHTECECKDLRDEDMPRDSALRSIELRHSNLPENSCRCPSEYSVRHLASGQCVCDCFDKQRDCIKYKKGKEYFNHRDRLCIEMESCLSPSCDFGMYNRRSGRCPRKHEKFRTWSSRFIKT